jgi:hypothetical protein
MSANITTLFSDNIPDASPAECGTTQPPPKAEPWFDLSQKAEVADTELIKHRFLCRRGGLLLVGQTGTGKSSFSRQMALHLATGEPFVGLQPVRPLKSLIIQAENDDQDEAEMCRGVVTGSGFTKEQLESAGPFIFHYREQVHRGLEFFSATVRPLISDVKPDLLLIDPLLAYLGGDQNSQEAVGGWLRNWLNPVLAEYNCGVVVVHHTAKMTRQKLKDGWGTGDYGYLGAGSAEFANWSRAILCLVPTGVRGIYELHAPKRGLRLDWKENDEATLTTKKMISHSRTGGQIHWHESKGEEVSFMMPTRTNGNPIPAVEEFLKIWFSWNYLGVFHWMV